MRGIVIRNVEGLVLPLSFFADSSRDVQILNSKRVAVIPDDQFDDVAAASRGLFGPGDDEPAEKDDDA